MSATLKPDLIAPRVSLLGLPFEILQQIASYLDDASAAKFSLCNRSTCYAIGTTRLSTYVNTSISRIEARERLENTIERALPGAWHCAWCDAFHSWSLSDGPTTEENRGRKCSDYNSYLSDEMGYTLRYHHVRLALAHLNHGSKHGLPLSTFEHASTSSITLFKTSVQTSISHAAKIKDGKFLHHTSFSALLPAWAAESKNLISHLWPSLPSLLTQHRASEYGHMGLMAALDNVVRRGWRLSGIQSCSDCETDWSITAFPLPRSVMGDYVSLNIQVWHDLGTGQSPFDTTWRSHGPFLAGTEESCVREEARREKGSVKRSFEDVQWGDSYNEQAESMSSHWEALAYSWQVDRRREEEHDQEREWRAIWQYVERRADMQRERLEHIP